MPQHELILLSPYRLPGQSSLTLADEDMAAWLNGYTALWHPALLWNAKGPPLCDTQYDHEQPRSHAIYAVPDSPPLYLPDDWQERVRGAESLAFRAAADRSGTLANARAELASAGRDKAIGWPAGFALDDEQTAAFFGLGMGYLLETTLAEAMEHENLLDATKFWNHVQQALAQLSGQPFTPAEPAYNPETAPRSEGDDDYEMPAHAAADAHASEPADWRNHLEIAAQLLMSAREVLYPVTIHLLDLDVLDDNSLDKPWPAGLGVGVPLNVVASGSLLEKLARAQPAKLESLRAQLAAGDAEVCGGCYLEREDPLLPLDSQLWNLLKGLEASRAVLEGDVRVFARKRFGFHAQLPLLLTTTGLVRALFLCFDEAGGVPQYSSTVVAWPSPDGKQVDAFVRAPQPADAPATFFNLCHYWFKTLREDHAATLVLAHAGKVPAPWYRDIVELARLAPVLGTWTTFSRYFDDVMAGEHLPSLSVDELHFDYLSERVNSHGSQPVSAFAHHLRLRRRLDACWTFAALHRSLGASQTLAGVDAKLRAAEDALEKDVGGVVPELASLETQVALVLAQRLQARAAADQPGTMLLNPCAFARRVAVELEGATRPLPVGGIIKACQLDDKILRAVVEVPALGFAWIPREGPPGTPPMAARLRVGDPLTRMIRNEFFEVEVDAVTGGLKAIRDHKTRVNRLGQRLVFNPGSRMIAGDIKVTLTGPALGEIVSVGELRGEQDQVLATFKQRLRVWLGRPLLEMRIELNPVQPAAGYPWHAYFGCRFAWRDERAILMRGAGGTGHVTADNRPQTPDFLELRSGGLGTVILPAGLPFNQRHEGRMLDIILQPEGEQATTFDLGIALDRETPMQTALGFSSPVAVEPTSQGPPHVGASGWLFHLDASNLLLTRLMPGTLETRAQGPNADAVTARLLECASHSGQAEFRSVRNPKRVVLLDASGQFLLEAAPTGDAVLLEVSPNDLVHVQVEFS